MDKFTIYIVLFKANIAGKIGTKIKHRYPLA